MTMHRMRYGRLLMAVMIALAGCAGAREGSWGPVEPPAVAYTAVADTVAPDPAMAALVTPYRDQLEAEVATVIGEAAAQFDKDQPEGALGNLAADAMLAVVQGHVDTPVQMALTNNGGLRIPLPAGPLTVGHMYELMPFENRLVVLDLSGVEVDSLAQQIARIGGEPIAGFSFTIDGSAARDIRVQDAPLDPNGRYRLVTSDYLADGGGSLPALWTPRAAETLPVLLRDAFVTYIREQQTLTPALDGRITRP